MDYYTDAQLAAGIEARFAFLAVRQAGHVLHLTLARPEKKNALHPHTLHELAYALQYARQSREIRAIRLSAQGDVFCAGADLKAFMGKVEPHDSGIPAPARPVLLGHLLQEAHTPIVAEVTGDVLAGGFLLLCGCTWVVAAEDVRLGLPEVQRGLFPFQVMEALMQVMPARAVLDWCLRGTDLPVAKAAAWGLVTHACPRAAVSATVEQLLAEVVAQSPAAIRLGLEAYDQLRRNPPENPQAYLQQMLLRCLQTPDAREGMQAFREGRPPVWS